MGEYPEDIYGRGRRGGVEILPGVNYQYTPSPGQDKESKMRALQIRLQRDVGQSAIDQLYEFVFKFHRLLHHPLTKERALHDLILEGAIFFSSTRIRILSEVRFANRFRADLVIQIDDNPARTILVELERANLPLFTRTGAPYAHVTHALQQVEDWMRFWQEHPLDVPMPLDPTITPSGVVVIGRSKFLSEDDKRRLMNLNSNRRVQIMTYDDLIAQVENYVTILS
jgi:hypothetical protein